MDLLQLYPSVKQTLTQTKISDARVSIEKVVRATLYSDLAIRSVTASGSNERLKLEREDIGVAMPFLESDEDIPSAAWDLPVAELLHRCPFLIGKVARRLRGLRLQGYTRAVVWRVALADEDVLDSLRRSSGGSFLGV